MWVVSRSTRNDHTVLGVFFFLDQARHDVEQQRIGHHGQVAYQIEHHAVRDRRAGLRLLVATRPWQLRCGHCGAAWIATAADVLAGDDWLACPRCRGWQVRYTRSTQSTREPSTESPPPDVSGDLPDRGLDLGGA